MMKGLAIPALAVLLGTITPFAAFAQDSAELLARMKAMEDRIKSLEAEVQSLRSDQAATQAALTAAAPPSAAATAQAAAPAKFRPLPKPRSVWAERAAQRDTAHHGTPALEMHESEVAFQEFSIPTPAPISSSASASTASNLEEGFLTFTALPAGCS